jgi:hypothetical protein
MRGIDLFAFGREVAWAMNTIVSRLDATVGSASSFLRQKI